ncbi:phenylalanine-tRNA synthetase [Cavenderia fasciculata]|uniref:phenylalanine--tRNA ligase n=1 Tax=Cavenderia fasciculata TaxID=261658 RepID=F4Q0B2_CACFS|nr:phenylalanine-tRNA synthetase [Cavenderia fasciculata]EGG18263.1 phenylalanine-tRNA synthetase [Cavenderia fasciculata]|eukprot:XP_004357086.1 phenylalanine-tRNA synthetase [Cavenderia fasciculata]
MILSSIFKSSTTTTTTSSLIRSSNLIYRSLSTLNLVNSQSQPSSSSSSSFTPSTLSSSSSSSSFSIYRRLYSSTPTPIIDYTKIIPKEGNIPTSILEKRGRSLHNRIDHPLSVIKKKIHYHFKEIVEADGKTITRFNFYDNFDSKVTSKQNFDDLLFPNDHIGRSPNDTYYFDENTLLRTHTSAHQMELLLKKNPKDTAFLVTGDVYRRDTIDSVHYPVFHQMEGVQTFTLPNSSETPFKFNPNNDYYNDGQYAMDSNIQFVEKHLKSTLESMIRSVIGTNLEVRWIDAYFPFTAPSWEMEILFQGRWLEVLGCGVVHPGILNAAGRSDEYAWAFGIGLERLAMILFDIPDIRLFWTEDDRFHRQFKGVDKKPEEITNIDISKTRFQPYSKFPSCFKDITFWLPQQKDLFHENHLYEFLRGEAGDLIEDVQLIDTFVHPKTGLTSQCYRINYRSMERNLTNEEIDLQMSNIRSKIENKLNIKLR